jgi:stress-induced morphogen
LIGIGEFSQGINKPEFQSFSTLILCPYCKFEVKCSLLMDHDLIYTTVERTLKAIDIESYQLFFADNNILKLEVVSDIFHDQSLVSRLQVLTTLFGSTSERKLHDFHFIYIPLTVNERNMALKNNI